MGKEDNGDYLPQHGPVEVLAPYQADCGCGLGDECQQDDLPRTVDNGG